MTIDHEHLRVTLSDFFEKLYKKYSGDDLYYHYILIKFPGEEEYTTLKYLFNEIDQEVYNKANLYLSQEIKKIELLLADGSRGIYITM